jgi:Zn-dependent protease
MKWSLKVGQIAGVGIYVHATFAILIAWIAAAAWSEDRTIGAVAEGVGFILALFGCIVLHEMGHALAARRFNIQTRDITLLPIGGMARLERMPEEPRQELIVALAGPAVNLVIAGVLWLGLSASGSWQVQPEMSALEGSFAMRLFVLNVFIMGFNLLPAFPMDGGRVLRALLATRMDYVAATEVAANVGQAMALGFGLIGLLANPFLIFIALFVWIGAAAEAGMVQMKSSIAGVSVEQAMLTSFQTLHPDDPLTVAVDLTLAGSQKDFLVVTEAGVLEGILSQTGLLAALAKNGPELHVGSALQPAAASAESHEMLEAVLTRLGESPCKTVPVTRGGSLVGMLTLDNVGELLKIQAALKSASPRLV